MDYVKVGQGLGLDWRILGMSTGWVGYG